MLNPQRDHDRRLAESLRDQRPGAVAHIYNEYGPRLFDYAEALLVDRDLAVDAVRAALLITRDKELPDDTRFRAWLYSLVRDECLNRLGARPRPRPADLDPPLVPQTPGRTVFHYAADDLERELADLKHHHGLAILEVAEVLGISVQQAAELEANTPAPTYTPATPQPPVNEPAETAPNVWGEAHAPEGTEPAAAALIAFDTSAAPDPSVVKDAPEGVDAPAAEQAPVVENAPVAEKAPVSVNAPVVEQAPVGENVPAAEKAFEGEKAPAAKAPVAGAWSEALAAEGGEAAAAATTPVKTGRVKAALAVEDLSSHPDDVRVAGARKRPANKKGTSGPKATARPGQRKKRLVSAAAGAAGVVVLAAGALSLMVLQPFADDGGENLGPQTAGGRTPDTRFETPTQPAVVPPVTPEQSPEGKPKDENSPPATRPQTKPSNKPKNSGGGGGGAPKARANGTLRISDGSCRGIAAPITRSCTISLTAVGGAVNWAVSGVNPGIARVSAGGGGTLSSGRSTSVRVSISPTVSCYARGFGSATVSFSPGGSARVSYTCW